jgi:hypothetical protein
MFQHSTYVHQVLQKTNNFHDLCEKDKNTSRTLPFLHQNLSFLHETVKMLVFRENNL